ncbi:DnaE DNA polymerase III, alpha subunit [Burkholderiales bacterium]
MHSEYSVVDGICRLDDAVAAAAADGQQALGLTDLGNTFGFIKFYGAARAKGVKPLLGADLYVTNPLDRDAPYRVLLLVQNDQGYKNLCTLISRAWLTNSYKDRGEVRFEWFSEPAQPAGATPGTLASGNPAPAPLHHGLICLSGGPAGEVGQALLRGGEQALALAQDAAQRYHAVFADRFYLEVQRAGTPEDDRLVSQTAGLAASLGIPLVATHPIQFVKPTDFRSHEAKVCIAEGETLANARRNRRFTPEQFLKTQAEMADLFSDLPSAIENTARIAARCSLTLQLGKPQLPDFPTPNGESLEDYLRSQSALGLERRLEERYPDPEIRAAQQATYEARLALECDTIIQMGFPGYFLIVADFINWAKNNGVPVGPGRGSGAGSLVAYCLGITDLDPLPYALLFERFLNPERVSMPDFDIDFCQEKRQRVIDYVRERYGKEAVSQIVTFGTMASRAVIRDAGRVLDLPYNFCDQLSKLIPVVQNKPLSLKEAMEKEPILAERAQKEDEVRELLAVASPLEDLVRNVGMHAGGVLIAPGQLTDFCPLYQAPGSKGDEGVVSMYDKDDVEAAGLVKFDFLGLKNLTVIQMAVDTINAARNKAGEAPLKLQDLNSFDDPAAYQVLKDANTTGIFQVESAGMRRYLLKLQPDQFEDIIAMLALYRPGPLNSGMVDDFIVRKRGQQKIDYFHSDLQECLAPTYGVIVYQEQVMQIAQIIAGYSLGGADLLRRAMGKKKPEEMAQQRSIFLEGARAKGHSEPLAIQLFDLMEKFAEYGFNKSHTAAYAVITYQTAWLKAHYPAEFMAATLSADLDDTDKVAFLVQDAKANGISVLPPDINASGYRFEPEGAAAQTTRSAKADQPQASQSAQAIRYGLGAIRGVGEAAVMNILASRAEGGASQDSPYKDLFDFVRRVDRRIVNKRAMEALVKAGAFDGLHPQGRVGRAQLVAAIGLAVQAADDAEAHADQAGLFGEVGADAEGALELPPAAPYSERQALLEEKLALGYCFSGSLFDDVAQEVRRFAPTVLAAAMPSREPVWLAGVVVDSRAQMTRRGMMRVVELDDGSGRMEVTVFNELYESRRSVLKVDEPLIVSAKVDHDEYSGSLRGSAVEILTLAEARLRYAKGVRLTIAANSSAEVPALIARLQAGLGDGGGQGHTAASPKAASNTNPPAGCPIYLSVQMAGQRCEVRLGDAWRLNPEPQGLERLRSQLENADLEVMYGN